MKKLLIISVLTFFSVLVAGQCELEFDKGSDYIKGSTGWNNINRNQIMVSKLQYSEESTFMSGITNYYMHFAFHFSDDYTFASGTKVLIKLSDGTVIEFTTTEEDFAKYSSGDTYYLYLTFSIEASQVEEVYRFGVEKIRLAEGSYQKDDLPNKEQMLSFQRLLKCLYLKELVEEDFEKQLYKNF